MSASKELKEADEILTLRDHIDKYHGGNQSDFARTIEVSKQQITKWLKNKVIMVNGSMYYPVKVNRKVDSIDEDS